MNNSNNKIDLLAEYTGRSANKFKLDANDRAKVIETLVAELTEALSERL